MRYFLAELDRQWLDARARSSFCSGDNKPGFVRLFNKNALETHYAKIVVQCQDRHGWIVELDDVPSYFSKVLKPESN